MKRVLMGVALLSAIAARPAFAREEVSGPLVVNGGLMIWTLIVFGLLFVVLKKFAWPAILGAVQAREAALEKQIADAERLNAEARAALEAQKKLLGEARSSAQAMLAEAKAFAEKERGVALEKTKLEQEQLLLRARAEVKAEKDKAVTELRREAVDLSLAAASKLIGQRLDSEADRSFVMNYLASLEVKH